MLFYGLFKTVTSAKSTTSGKLQDVGKPNKLKKDKKKNKKTIICGCFFCHVETHPKRRKVRDDGEKRDITLFQSYKYLKLCKINYIL